MATSSDTLVQNPVLNDLTKTIYDSITPVANEIYAVDMEYTGNKVVKTDDNGDLVETDTSVDKLAYLNNVTGDIQAQLVGKVNDVTVSGTSIVDGASKVAEIPIAAQGGDYGLIKLRSSAYGLGVDSSGFTIVNRATTSDIDERTAYYKPITPLNLDYAVKIGITDNKTALTDAEKTSANVWLGSVKDVTISGTSIVDGTTKIAALPIATAGGDYGLVKVSSDSSGLMIASSGYLQTRRATDGDITASPKTQINRPIVPANLDLAVTRGIVDNSISVSNATGSNYTTYDQENGLAWLGAQSRITQYNTDDLISVTEKFNLPAGYTQLEYAINDVTTEPSTRTKLNLGIKPQDGDIIDSVFECKSVGTSNYYVNARPNTGTSIYGISGAQSDNAITCSVNGSSATTISVIRKVGHKYYTRASYIGGTATIYAKDLTDNTEETATASYTWADINSNYYLWGSNANTLDAEQPCQYVRITNNGNLRCLIVPATNGANVGFYDLVNKTFITTMTIGAITGSENIVDRHYIHFAASERLTWYGTCATTAGTQIKTVVCPGFELREGATLRVKFTTGNTYSGAAQLKVNDLDAIPVSNVYAASPAAGNSRYMWGNGEVVEFTYDGTEFIMTSKAQATTTYYGVTKLYSSAASSSQAYALTPYSLYTFANSSICPYYSSSVVYKKGDVVRYTYYVYECNIDMTAAEAWNADHWTQLPTLQEQIKGLTTTTIRHWSA